MWLADGVFEDPEDGRGSAGRYSVRTSRPKGLGCGSEGVGVGVCLRYTVVTRILRLVHSDGSSRIRARRSSPVTAVISRHSAAIMSRIRSGMLLALAGRGDRGLVNFVRVVRMCGGRHGGREYWDSRRGSEGRQCDG